MVLRVIKIVISIIYCAGCRFYEFLYYFSHGTHNRKAVVLTYHSIKDNQVYEFEKQMNKIVNTGLPINLDDIDKINHKKRCYAVTFDDGYQSVYKNAIPIIQKRNIPATIFLTTGFLGKKPGWITDTKNDDKHETLITEEQIKELLPSSIRFGSHTVSHPHLDKIEKNELYFEINESKKRLETILQMPVDTFSIPFGSYNDTVIENIHKAGYNKIFLNVPFTNTKGSDSCQLYGRIDVSPDDWDIEFRLKLLGAYEWLPIGIYIKKHVSNISKV